MKISSEHINNLLAYARERHGAPCRVEFETGWDRRIQMEIYYRDLEMDQWPLERILI